MTPEDEKALDKLTWPLLNSEERDECRATIRLALEAAETRRDVAEKNAAAFCGENERLKKALEAPGHARNCFCHDTPLSFPAPNWLDCYGRGLSSSLEVHPHPYRDPRCEAPPAPATDKEVEEAVVHTHSALDDCVVTGLAGIDDRKRAHAAINRLAVLARRARKE